MKGEFITYDALNSGAKASTVPITHFAKGGVISINASAVNAIGLKAGDQIKFFQSKKNPKEWYFAKDPSSVNAEGQGLTIRKAYDKKSNGLMLNSSFTVKSIMRAMNVSKGFKVQIGSEPDADGWWSLITSGVK
ncbi:MAG: hypothetical protein MUP53_00365 [Bacteroidales bacterium]|nr:hypothetical protein [Bacteroidales bacterium]